MIVVLEGPSAAGKTTWGRTHAGPVLVEEERRPAPNPPRDQRDAAKFWAQRGASRWEDALAVESESEVAVCDTDPLKLHYAWSLWRIGMASKAAFRDQAAAYRNLVAGRRLGFADLYFVLIPAASELAVRKVGDASRERRHFEVHRRLDGPIREWYAAIEALRPGSVVWEFPETGISGLSVAPRDRHRLGDFDALVGRLGGVGMAR